MGVSVRLILSIYRRLYLMSFPSPSVVHPFVGGGDIFCPSSVSQAGGGYFTVSCPFMLSYYDWLIFFHWRSPLNLNCTFFYLIYHVWSMFLIINIAVYSILIRIYYIPYFVVMSDSCGTLESILNVKFPFFSCSYNLSIYNRREFECNVSNK